MQIEKISSLFNVTRLTEDDVDVMLQLCSRQTIYYRHCLPFVTRQSLIDDLHALPSGKTFEDKYYLGLWQGDVLVAVLDLVLKYPDERTAFIGFFMMNVDFEGQGTGSAIIEQLVGYLKQCGFRYVRLGYVKGNEQSRHFWTKNKFIEVGISVEKPQYTVVVLQRCIDQAR